MRRSDREVTGLEEIRQVIDKCKVCRVAMADEEGLYIVPLNFGYEFEGNNLVLYIHSAKDGRKVRAFAPTCPVAVEMDCETGLIEGDTACRYGYAFSSVIGSGRAFPMADTAEKIHGLKLLMFHQTGKDFDFTAAQADTVEVFKIVLPSFTCKTRR